MKCKLLLGLTISGLMLTSALFAKDKVIYPTIPGTDVRDYSKPGYVVRGDKLDQTYPGTSVRDWSKPSYYIEKGVIYETIPGTDVRNYSKPGFKIDD